MGGGWALYILRFYDSPSCHTFVTPLLIHPHDTSFYYPLLTHPFYYPLLTPPFITPFLLHSLGGRLLWLHQIGVRQALSRRQCLSLLRAAASRQSVVGAKDASAAASDRLGTLSGFCVETTDDEGDEGRTVFILTIYGLSTYLSIY